MSRPIHFEIHAQKPERAAKFYRKIFGWNIKKWKGLGWDYWMIMTAPEKSKKPGINGGMLFRKGHAPKDGACMTSFVCTMVVKNLDKTGKDILKAGGKLAMAKFDIAGMAWQAYYKDTEGNIFGIHEPVKKNKK